MYYTTNAYAELAMIAGLALFLVGLGCLLYYLRKKRNSYH